jgi:MFS family permease
MGKYGRKNILTIAMFLSSLSALVFGAASYIQDSQNFYLMSAAARTILGFGEGMAMTCVPAIIAAEFAKEHQLRY